MRYTIALITSCLTLLMLPQVACKKPDTSQTKDAPSKANPNNAQDLKYCFGRYVPERKDDYAWENDKVAFRIYGPALAATPGETSGSGVDAWSKRVSYPVIDNWYKHGDYHRDHGEGLDAYSVGTSRGCGGTGVFMDGKIYSAGVWKTQRTITTGSERVIFEVTYAPYQIGDVRVTETKRVSLDYGSFFSRFQTTVHIEGAESVPFVTGLVRRKNEEDPICGAGWVAAMEPETANGRIGTAIIMQDSEMVLADGHALLVKQVKNGETVEHWSGTCWTKEGSFKDINSWAEHTKDFAQKKRLPDSVAALRLLADICQNTAVNVKNMAIHKIRCT